MTTFLLSLISLSCMIVPNRELVNILFPFNISILSISIAYNNKNIDMNIKILRSWSVNSSTNSSRESSTCLSVSSIPYVERIEAQNNDLSWTKQVDEYNNFQGFSLFYTSLKIRDNNTN